MKIFESTNAGKEIDGAPILKEITLSISQGEKIAITGPNGSGKSSLLKLIGGIYEETSGQIQRKPIELGYVPEHFPENIRFKLEEYLILMGKMCGKTEEEILKKIEDYGQLFGITEFFSTPLRKCSKGTKQKAGIIQALLKEPNLLLLDEPLTGLDDQSQIELLNQLRNLGKERTIIFTAHDPHLIEGLAERVITIVSGKIASDTGQIKNAKLKLIKAHIPSRDILSELPSVHYVHIGENTVEITVSAKESDKILLLLLERGCSINEVKEEW